MLNITEKYLKKIDSIIADLSPFYQGYNKVVDGWKVFTDGRILLLFPLIPDAPFPEHAVPEKLRPLNIEEKRIVCNLSELPKCEKCGGTGYHVIHVCDECGGDGAVVLTYEGKYHNYEETKTCLRCFGSGKASGKASDKASDKASGKPSHLECQHCDGTGIKAGCIDIQSLDEPRKTKYAHFFNLGLDSFRYNLVENGWRLDFSFETSNGTGYGAVALYD